MLSLCALSYVRVSVGHIAIVPFQIGVVNGYSFSAKGVEKERKAG